MELIRSITTRLKSSRPFQLAKTVLSKTEGYHFGVTWCAISSAVVFLINLLVTIWASSHYGTHGGFGTIQNGNCNKTKKLATWLHLAINVLSTFLLGASNYTMQCLSSPTRKEIDKAHHQKVALDVGIPSIRNLRRIAPPRLILWLLIAVSSVPLHLLYNSAVFSTLSAREYTVFLVTEGFLKGKIISCLLSTLEFFVFEAATLSNKRVALITICYSLAKLDEGDPFQIESIKACNSSNRVHLKNDTRNGIQATLPRSDACKLLQPQLQHLQDSAADLRELSEGECRDTYSSQNFTASHTDVVFVMLMQKPALRAYWSSQVAYVFSAEVINMLRSVLNPKNS